MSFNVGPLDVCCDAPPYAIVRACANLGFQHPEDVRWWRRGQRSEQPVGWRDLLQHPWKLWRQSRARSEKACVCGRALPPLDLYTFTYASSGAVSYLLGQCLRCRAIVWDEPAVVPPRRLDG
jgi:hypothetical protein